MYLEPYTTPNAIEERSFAIIEEQLGSKRPYTGLLWEVARRCIHTTGDLGILDGLKLSEAGLTKGLKALEAGCTIYTDTRMVACGLTPKHFNALNCKIVALMDLPGVAAYAANNSCTRARAGIEMLGEKLSGQIVAIGNAPTALLALLDVLELGLTPPALIIGMPVGFVNASPAKKLLYNSSYTNFTLLGTRGGSPLAAACVNALAEIVVRNKD